MRFLEHDVVSVCEARKGMWCEEVTESKLAIRKTVREVKFGVRPHESPPREQVSEMRVVPDRRRAVRSSRAAAAVSYR